MASSVAKKSAPPAEAARRPVAFLFELEGPAIRAHSVLFDTCRNVVAERDGELTEALFLRFCLDAGPVRFAAPLLGSLGKKRLSAEKFAGDLQKAYQDALMEDRVKPLPAFTKLLGKLRAQNVALGCLSSLAPEAVDPFLKKLQWDTLGVKVFCADPAAELFPSPDAWLKVAKLRGVSPAGCVVLSSSERSCRAALAGRMTCVVWTDSFTGFQDFSGADRMFGDLDEEAAAGIQQLILRA